MQSFTKANKHFFFLILNDSVTFEDQSVVSTIHFENEFKIDTAFNSLVLDYILQDVKGPK